jgi:acetylornithine deacetylase/succinyl-diaminopimelate desuccinylase-like protein
MIRLMQAVESAPMPTHPIIGSAQITLTDIISEPYPGHSVVPNRCRVSYDRRLVPGETPEGIVAAIQSLPGLENIKFRFTVLEGEEKTYTGKVLKGIKFFPAWSFAEDHAIVQAALRGLQSAGLPARLGSFGFCTNGAYSAGVAGIPTIGFGPGLGPDAHTVNERMKVEDIELAAAGFLEMIQSILR